MRWLIGLDLRPNSQGAIRLAAWLHDAAPTAHELHAVHVLESPDRYNALRLGLLDAEELANLVSKSADAVLTEAGVRDAYANVAVTSGTRAEHDLAGASEDVDGLIIGRHARREGRELVRLGRVARRLTRMLPVPIVVTPPDLRVRDIGTGPIVATTDLTDGSIEACRFARALARSIDRKLVIAHVIPTPDELVLGFLPEQAREGLHQKYRVEQAKALEQWVIDNDFGDIPTRLEQGDPSQALPALARQEASPMIVCGSRKLALHERILSSSLGTTLAGSASCAVALVPPGPRGAP